MERRNTYRAATTSPFLRKPGEVVRTIKTQADMDTLTADCTREALEFIRSSKDKSFFLYLAYHMPHVPLGASEKFRGKSQRGLYGDVIEELDDAVGQLLSELKAQSLDDNTLIIFTSDNGPWTDKQIGDHGGSPGPFRGAKMTTWEGGWRVPCIVRWPGKVRAGETSDGITSTLDWMPTFAKLASGKAPSVLAESKAPDAAKAATTLDGRDLTTFLTTTGASSPRETFLYHNGPRLTAVRHKEWKLVFARPAGGEMPYMPTFVTSHIEALPETALYNLRNDPAETKNLANERPTVVKLLTQLADESRADLGDFNGPGSGARFYEVGPRWPRASSKEDSIPKRKTKTKATEAIR